MRLVSLKYLAAVLVAAVIVIVLVSTFGSRSVRLEQPMLFSLDDGEPSISTIELSRGNAGVTLVYADSGWQVGGESQLRGHSVNPAMVARVIRFVTAARYVEKKTNRGERLTKLGLELEDQGSVVRGPVLLSVTAGSKNVSLLIGNSAQSGLGTYVRYPQETQAWLVSGQVELPVDAIDWLSPVFLNVDRADITRAKFTTPADGLVVVSASGATDSAIIENMPEGASLAYPSVADPALASLVNLRLVDAKKANQISWDGASIAEFNLSSGASLLLRCVEQKGTYWVWVDRDGVKDEWGYAVDEFRFAQLTNEMGDYLEQEHKE